MFSKKIYIISVISIVTGILIITLLFNSNKNDTKIISTEDKQIINANKLFNNGDYFSAKKEFEKVKKESANYTYAQEKIKLCEDRMELADKKFSEQKKYEPITRDDIINKHQKNDEISSSKRKKLLFNPRLYMIENYNKGLDEEKYNTVMGSPDGSTNYEVWIICDDGFSKGFTVSSQGEIIKVY